MRSYLYLWNDPAARRLIASGLELHDLVPVLAGRGLYLLRHQWHGGEHQGLTFTMPAEVPVLASQDLYSWGDLMWADFPPPEPPTLPPESLAELLYFAHTAEPLRGVEILGLGNRFLAHSHDDGWSLHLHYSEWRHAVELLELVLPPAGRDAIVRDLGDGTCAYWIEADASEREEMTLDIDRLLNRRL